MAGGCGQAEFLHADIRSEPVHAPWASRLFDLGRALRARPRSGAWQTVVLVSVPTRELAACLIVAGWSLSRPLPEESVPSASILEGLKAGTYVRLGVSDRIIEGPFYEYNARRRILRVRGSGWLLDHVRFLREVDPGATPSGSHPYPEAGALLKAEIGVDSLPAFWWSARVDSAVIGVKAHLEAELHVGISPDGHSPDLLGNLVMPTGSDSPFTATQLISGIGNPDIELNSDIGLVVLDGQRGMSWLEELWEQPLIVGVIDRTQPDELVVDSFLQHRASGRPLSLTELGWEPGNAVQGLAYEVAR